MKIVQFNRKRSTPGSIEILFGTIRKYMSKDVEVFIPSYESRGLFKRLAIMWEAYRHQGDVNHITGDIHFASFLLQKSKTILTVHDCVSVIHSKGLKRVVLKLFWFTLPLQRVQYVTVISEKTKEELLSLVSFPLERIFVIPDCISDRYHYVEKKEFNKDCPRILQIGTKTNKNLVRVAEALHGISCVLDIVGELSTVQLEALKKYNIVYENAVNISEDELIKKYVDSDIVAFVSAYEGFGMPTLEAQTVGRAVLTSNISPMLEVAGKDGAFFVDPYDVTAMKKGFTQLMEDDVLRTKLIGNGLENVKSYRPEKIAQMYVDVYQQVAHISADS